MLRTWFVFGRLRALAPDSASGVKANLYKLQNKQVLVILFSLDLSNTGIEKEKKWCFKRVLLEPCNFLVFLPFLAQSWIRRRLQIPAPAPLKKALAPALLQGFKLGCIAR